MTESNDLSPTVTLARLPAAPFSILKFTEEAINALRATSHELVNTRPPTGSNSKWQSAGSAVTVTGALASAFSSAGLAAWVSRPNAK